VISAMAQAIDIVEEMHQKTTLDTQVSEREQVEKYNLVWSIHDSRNIFIRSSLSIPDISRFSFVLFSYILHAFLCISVFCILYSLLLMYYCLHIVNCL
jgi:hypothetical protein